MIAESETKSNEVFKFRVGQHIFEGKLTNENLIDGELPKGWKWRTINEIGKIKGGKRLDFVEITYVKDLLLRILSLLDGGICLSK